MERDEPRPDRDEPRPLAIWVSLPAMTFALDIGANSVVTRAAPISRWCVGRRAQDVLFYYLGRGAQIAALRTPPPHPPRSTLCTEPKNKSLFRRKLLDNGKPITV